MSLFPSSPGPETKETVMRSSRWRSSKKHSARRQNPRFPDLGRRIDTSSTWLNMYIVCADEGYQRCEEERDGGEREMHGGDERKGAMQPSRFLS
jgi:hypothetical protein